MASGTTGGEQPPVEAKSDVETDLVTGLDTGPFVLRPLFKEVPLSADSTDEDIKINCVDYLGTASLQTRAGDTVVLMLPSR